MKRIRMLILLGMVAVALPLGLLQGIAKATGGGGSSGTTNSVYIQQYADYDFVGTQLDVGLYVRCSGGSGTVIVDVTQSPPETPFPVSHGSGPQLVVCNGSTHSVGVTITGFGFDAGKAWAKATLTAPSGSKTAQRSIQIIVV
jgi:hypothetical protein